MCPYYCQDFLSSYFSETKHQQEKPAQNKQRGRPQEGKSHCTQGQLSLCPNHVWRHSLRVFLHQDSPTAQSTLLINTHKGRLGQKQLLFALNCWVFFQTPATNPWRYQTFETSCSWNVSACKGKRNPQCSASLFQCSSQKQIAATE